MITQAPLSITAQGSQVYGGSNPSISYTYTGLVNGDKTSSVTGVSFSAAAAIRALALAFRSVVRGLVIGLPPEPAPLLFDRQVIVPGKVLCHDLSPDAPVEQLPPHPQG